MFHYLNIDHMIDTALMNGWINPEDREALRRVIFNHTGWSSSLMDTGLTPDGADLYAVCADYL